MISMVRGGHPLLTSFLPGDQRAERGRERGEEGVAEHEPEQHARHDPRRPGGKSTAMPETSGAAHADHQIVDQVDQAERARSR